MYFSHNTRSTFGDNSARVVGVIYHYPVIAHRNIEIEKISDPYVITPPDGSFGNIVSACFNPEFYPFYSQFRHFEPKTRVTRSFFVLRLLPLRVFWWPKWSQLRRLLSINSSILHHQLYALMVTLHYWGQTPIHPN